MRLDVGDSVMCRTADGWMLGVVIAHDYRESHWPQGQTVPYQVELKGGRLIYAPVDDDQLIASAAQPLSEPGLLEAVSEHMPVSVGDIPRGERVAWLQRTLHASHHSDDDGSSLGATLNAEEAAATERTHILYREHVQKKISSASPSTLRCFKAR